MLVSSICLTALLATVAVSKECAWIAGDYKQEAKNCCSNCNPEHIIYYWSDGGVAQINQYQDADGDFKCYGDWSFGSWWFTTGTDMKVGEHVQFYGNGIFNAVRDLVTGTITFHWNGCDFTLTPIVPTLSPTPSPTDSPTPSPTPSPTASPTPSPTDSPTAFPTPTPTDIPTPSPTDSPTPSPTDYPTPFPTAAPFHPKTGRASTTTPATSDKDKLARANVAIALLLIVLGAQCALLLYFATRPSAGAKPEPALPEPAEVEEGRTEDLTQGTRKSSQLLKLGDVQSNNSFVTSPRFGLGAEVQSESVNISSETILPEAGQDTVVVRCSSNNSKVIL